MKAESEERDSEEREREDNDMSPSRRHLRSLSPPFTQPSALLTLLQAQSKEAEGKRDRALLRLLLLRHQQQKREQQMLCREKKREKQERRDRVEEREKRATRAGVQSWPTLSCMYQHEDMRKASEGERESGRRIEEPRMPYIIIYPDRLPVYTVCSEM